MVFASDILGDEPPPTSAWAACAADILGAEPTIDFGVRAPDFGTHLPDPGDDSVEGEVEVEIRHTGPDAATILDETPPVSPSYGTHAPDFGGQVDGDVSDEHFGPDAATLLDGPAPVAANSSTSASPRFPSDLAFDLALASDFGTHEPDYGVQVPDFGVGEVIEEQTGPDAATLLDAEPVVPSYGTRTPDFGVEVDGLPADIAFDLAVAGDVVEEKTGPDAAAILDAEPVRPDYGTRVPDFGGSVDDSSSPIDPDDGIPATTFDEVETEPASDDDRFGTETPDVGVPAADFGTIEVDMVGDASAILDEDSDALHFGTHAPDFGVPATDFGTMTDDGVFEDRPAADVEFDIALMAHAANRQADSEEHTILGSQSVTPESPGFEDYLAERVAASRPLLAKTEQPLSESREWSIDFGPVSAPAGYSTTITISPQVLFRGEKILANDTAAPAGTGTRITSVAVGQKVQRPANGGTLTRFFAADALANGILFDTAHPWSRIAVTVSFMQAVTFDMSVFGRAVL